METWKVLFGLSVILVLFGTVASLLDVSITSPKGFGLLLGAIIGGVLALLVSKRGYRIGRSIGKEMVDEE